MKNLNIHESEMSVDTPFIDGSLYPDIVAHFTQSDSLIGSQEGTIENEEVAELSYKHERNKV